MNPQNPYLADSVGCIILTSLTPLALIILPPQLAWDSLSSNLRDLIEYFNLGSLSTYCMAVSLYLGSHQLLGNVSLMIIELGPNL